MPKIIKIKQGDCLISLSSREHLPWDKVWQDPNNQDLRQKRKYKLNILKPGDEVYIPDLNLKTCDCATEKTHHFVVEIPTVNFEVALMKLGKPRANEKYILKISGQPNREGSTDDNGTLKEKIPALARTGTLLMGEHQELFDIYFGSIDPIEEISGVQSRLFNLGFFHGAIDDQLNDATTSAVADFQHIYKLSGEGKLNDETRQKLVEIHGS